MSRSLNKVQILGHLGNDPESQTLRNGSAFTRISVATSRRYKNRDDEEVEETEWHTVKAFGKLAEIIDEYTSKGKQVYVEGRLHTEKWEDKDTGKDRYSTVIIAEQVILLGGGDGAKGGGRDRDDRRSSKREERGGRGRSNDRGRRDDRRDDRRSAKRDDDGDPGYDERDDRGKDDDDFDDDIPF